MNWTNYKTYFKFYFVGWATDNHLHLWHVLLEKNKSTYPIISRQKVKNIICFFFILPASAFASLFLWASGPRSLSLASRSRSLFLASGSWSCCRFGSWSSGSGSAPGSWIPPASGARPASWTSPGSWTGPWAWFGPWPACWTWPVKLINNLKDIYFKIKSKLLVKRSLVNGWYFKIINFIICINLDCTHRWVCQLCTFIQQLYNIFIVGYSSFYGITHLCFGSRYTEQITLIFLQI